MFFLAPLKLGGRIYRSNQRAGKVWLATLCFKASGVSPFRLGSTCQARSHWLMYCPRLPSQTQGRPFFARAPADASTEEIHDLFSQLGDVEGINIYRSWPSAKSSKGCGKVQFAARASALAARQALHGSKAFERAEAPLVVEPLDLRKQKQPPAASTVQQKARDTASACLPAHMSSGSSGNGP
ncbi:hypothetical protein OEZ86_005685 [Tetradesmus obliquus]|nr:hypothetical protein OEZ86_005685 [Tetradesmus obliquus]